ncbi:hypothetical protein V6Z11_D09G225400 [Gossypium hirsutum]
MYSSPIVSTGFGSSFCFLHSADLQKYFEACRVNLSGNDS